MFHILPPAATDWLDAVRELPDRALVKAASPQRLSEVASINDTLLTVLRYINDSIQDVNPNDTDLVRANRSRDWYDRFVDGTFLYGETNGIAHAIATKVLGFWNEFYANSQTPEEKMSWILQERMAAKIWMEEYRHGPHADLLGHIRLAICAAPVGNDIPLESAKTASMYDCILDYHGYDKYLGFRVRDPLSWLYHCGRWNTMDKEFRANGYFDDIILGESGPYSTVVDGWRSKKVLGGNVDDYVASVERFLKEILQTNAYKTGRFLGFALFTTGGNWPLYDTRAPEMIKIAKMVSKYWNPTSSSMPTNPSTPPVTVYIPEEDPVLIEHLRQVSFLEQLTSGIQLNPAVGLQQRIVADGCGETWWPVHGEVTTTFNGESYTIQAVEHSMTGDRRIYVYQPGKPIWYIPNIATYP